MTVFGKGVWQYAPTGNKAGMASAPLRDMPDAWLNL